MTLLVGGIAGKMVEPRAKGRNKGTRTKSQAKTPAINRPRTRSIEVRLDPEGGHGPASSAFSITLKVAVKDQDRLRDYIRAHPQGFLTHVERGVISDKAVCQTKTRPIDKRRPRSIEIHLDSKRGYGPASSAFSIKLKVIGKDEDRLIHYIRTDRSGFLSDVERDVISQVPDFPVEKHRGLHAKTHRLEQAIRKLATQIYVLAEHWTQKKREDWPEGFSKLITHLTALYDGQLADYFLPKKEAGRYRPDGIAHASIFASPLGKLAIEQGLSCSVRMEGGVLQLNVANFMQSYVDKSFLNKLHTRYARALAAGKVVRRQMYMLDTRKWLKQLEQNQDHWKTQLRIESKLPDLVSSKVQT